MKESQFTTIASPALIAGRRVPRRGWQKYDNESAGLSEWIRFIRLIRCRLFAARQRSASSSIAEGEALL
jgi:hypothetical protein